MKKTYVNGNCLSRSQNFEQESNFFNQKFLKTSFFGLFFLYISLRRIKFALAQNEVFYSDLGDLRNQFGQAKKKDRQNFRFFFENPPPPPAREIPRFAPVLDQMEFC